MIDDLYIWFLFGIVILAGIFFVYLCQKKMEIAVFFFALTPLISAIFYENLPEDPLVVTEATIEIGGMIRAAILVILGTVGIFKYLSNISKDKWQIPIHFFLLIVFAVFSFSSILYSLDQRFTLIRSGLLFAVIGFLLGLNVWLKEDDNIKKALNSLFVLVTIIIFLTLLSIFVFPSRVWWWKANRLIGLWEQPNSNGAFIMLSYPILIWKFYTTQNNKKYLVLIPLLINIGLHILSGSRTTILASSVGVFIWLLLEKNWVKLFSVSSIMGFLIIILLNFSPASFERGESLNVTDLSAREDIWNSAIVFVKERPLFGYGYGVEGAIFQNELKVDLEDSFIERNVRQSMHSGYLSIIVGLGIFGLLLWAIVLLFPLKFSLSVPFSPEKAFAIFTIIVVLITNFVESSLTGYSQPTDIFFWLSWVILGAIWNTNLQNNKSVQIN